MCARTQHHHLLIAFSHKMSRWLAKKKFITREQTSTANVVEVKVEIWWMEVSYEKVHNWEFTELIPTQLYFFWKCICCSYVGRVMLFLLYENLNPCFTILVYNPILSLCLPLGLFLMLKLNALSMIKPLNLYFFRLNSISLMLWFAPGLLHIQMIQLMVICCLTKCNKWR